MSIPLIRPGARLIQGAALCVAGLAISGCGSMGYDSSLSAAQVRFVDVSPGSPAMDFFVNGSGAAYGVGYANYTSYLPVSPGTANVSARRTGSGLPLASAEMNLMGGRQYTAVLSHGLGAMQERFYLDQDTPAAAGQVALRVLDETEGGRPLSVYVSAGTAGASGTPSAVLSLSAGSASGYLNLPAAATYTVTVTVAEGALSVPVCNVVVKAGSGAVRTVVLAGVDQAGSRNVVGFVLDDADPQ